MFKFLLFQHDYTLKLCSKTNERTVAFSSSSTTTWFIKSVRLEIRGDSGETEQELAQPIERSKSAKKYYRKIIGNPKRTKRTVCGSRLLTDYQLAYMGLRCQGIYTFAIRIRDPHTRRLPAACVPTALEFSYSTVECSTATSPTTN